MIQRILKTENNKATVFIRLATGIIFLSEGLQKFIFPATLGSGRFEKIGFPFPHFLAGLTGSFEILCGALILAGLLVRMAAIPLMVIMAVAIISTKVPMLANQGFWEMMHGSRTDISMFFCSLYLLVKGGGYFSADYKISNAKI